MKTKIYLRFILIVIVIIQTSLVSLIAFGCSHESNGKFYSLENSYESGLLTKEDLTSIAYYHNNGVAYPRALETEIEEAIKETACDRLREDYDIKSALPEDIEISEYYGVYNGYYAVVISDIYIMHPADVPQYTKDIGGVIFYYIGYGTIEIWNAYSDL